MAIFSITSEIEKEIIRLEDRDIKPKTITLSADQAFDLLDEWKLSFHDVETVEKAKSITLRRDEEELILFLNGMHFSGLLVKIMRLVS